MSVTQVMNAYQSILQEEVEEMARACGAVKRQRKNGLDAATLVQMVIFGFWQDPDLRYSGMAQVAARRDVSVSEPAISQRFTFPCAQLFLSVLQRLSQVHLQSEAVQVPLLQQFSAVIVEDSSSVSLPDELSSYWRGCGGGQGVSGASVKLFVRWDVLTGRVLGPLLCDGRTNDHHSPFCEEELPVGSLYLADLGFFAVNHFQRIARGQGGKRGGKRFFVTRWQPNTNLYTRRGHRLDLRGILPQKVGQVREMGGVLGKKQGLAVRLVMVRVPPDVAEQRQQRIREAAQKQGREPSEEVLYLAQWTIVLTNVAARRANAEHLLVLLRLRWQIERLFRMWKEGGKIDEWRSCKPARILCEFYGKLCAMVMQSSLLQEGCWFDPTRSLFKAAAAIRREVNRLMVAFYEGGVEHTVVSLLRCVRSGCRVDRRGPNPNAVQLLLEGLDWNLELLLT